MSLVTPEAAVAAGPDAVMTPAGYAANSVARGDDTSNLVVNMPFAMNWNGTSFTQIYINMNGNCTFGAGYTGYNPNTTLASSNRNIMAPFWADVDTRNTAAAQVTYSSVDPGTVPQVDGHDAFFVNWVGVASYNNLSTPTNSFQLVIVDRSDTGAGNFDFMFNYDQVTWDIATAASTVRARAGWGRAGTGYELPGSGTAQGSPSALLDDSPSSTSLIQNSISSDGQLGRYVWQVRGGAAPNTPPHITVTNQVLEGNALNSYVGYTGLGDAAAADPDGSITSLTNNLPTVLPLGITDVTWTATDDRGAVTIAHQSVEVTDSVAPDNPTLSSPTHQTGIWSTDSTVSVESSGAADVCTGVRGFSYGWSQDAASSPDMITDAALSTTVTESVNVMPEDQAFASGVWPSDWTRVLLTGTGAEDVYIRSQDVRANGGFAAELWTNANNTRRTLGFYKDFDLTGYESAVISFSGYSVGLDNDDYGRFEISEDGGATWSTSIDTTKNAGWTPHSQNLTVGGSIRVRFSGSVNRRDEYCDWDDIRIDGVKTKFTTTYTTSDTRVLADGTWYYSLRTVDEVGNWSVPVSLGPFLVDTTAPVTADDVPSGWSTSVTSVALIPTDAGLVTATRYSLNGGPWTDYTVPVDVAIEGTSTLRYYSADAAGHVEVTRTATIRVDTLAPSMPTSPSASAVSTNAVEIGWGLSTDSVSGLSHYAVYRDGALVETTTATTYVDTGLVAGATHSYQVCAVDFAGNESARTPAVVESIPVADLWISIDSASVDMGSIDPGTASTVTNASVVTVGGVGELGYDLLCDAQDFVNADSGASMLTLPAGALAYQASGHASIPQHFFGTMPSVIDTSIGTKYRWSYDYIFDYSFVVPWTFEPGVYSTTITYTVVGN